MILKCIKRKGFTLAEILVTLGIIGVIASMTIPNLVQDIQDAQFKTAWKKSFADVSQATKLLSQEYGGSFTGICNTSHACVRDMYLKYFNYTKTCNHPGIVGNCWNTDGAKGLNGGYAQSPSWFNGAALVNNNGQFYYFEFDPTYCNPSCYRFLVDVNGLKGPNIAGKDIYWMNIYNGGIARPYGYGFSSLSCPSGNGLDCSARYLLQ